MLIPQAIVQSGGTWNTYDCAPTGFSPSATQRSSRYITVGNICIVYVDITGTSNATTFTFNLPIAATRSYWAFSGQGTDNGVNPSTPMLVAIGVAPTSTAIVYKDWTGLVGFTASGNKSIQTTLIYEI